MQTITVASLVRNRDWILPIFLDYLNKLSYDKQQMDLLFIVNDSTDKSLSILKEFKEKNTEYNKITIDIFNRNVPEDKRTLNVRKNHIYNHLAILRNRAMKLANTEKFLFIDSDILAPSNLIENLLSQNKEIISSLIWNGYDLYPNQPWKYPNIMKATGNINGKITYQHISNYYVKNSPDLKEDKVIEVDLTGAIMLMDRCIYKHAKYADGLNGEDSAFCENVKNLGYKIWCNVGLFSNHIMNKNLLIGSNKS